MADGFAQLDAHIARLEALAAMPERAAPAVARGLEREILGNVRRGVSPDGKAWTPTQAGNLPLQNTGSELAVVAVRSTVVARLTGIHARHHLGAVRGGIARPILPASALPVPMVSSITEALTSEFGSTMGVGR